MLHLTLETIARLVDDAPNADEAAHLASCDVCREELDAMRQQTFALTNLGDSKPPKGSWSALEKRLERERLIVPPNVIALPPRAERRQWQSTLLRSAAAVVIFVLGGMSGAWMRGSPANNLAVTGANAPQVATATQQSAPDAAAQPAAENATEPVQQVMHTAANTSSNNAAGAAPRETTDVSSDVRTAEAAYLRALARYTEQRSPASAVGDPVARLAALESILLTTKAALHESPADPVINGYHLTALAERDAVLKQIAVEQSSDRRLVSNTNNTWF